MLKLLGALLALVLALLASTLSPWAAMGQAALLALLLLCLLALAMRPRSGVAWADGAARADRHALAVIAENAGMMSSFTRVVAASREQQTLLAGLREGVDVLADSVRTVVQSADITHDEVRMKSAPCTVWRGRAMSRCAARPSASRRSRSRPARWMRAFVK